MENLDRFKNHSYIIAIYIYLSQSEFAAPTSKNNTSPARQACVPLVMLGLPTVPSQGISLQHLHRHLCERGIAEVHQARGTWQISKGRIWKHGEASEAFNLFVSCSRADQVPNIPNLPNLPPDQRQNNTTVGLIVKNPSRSVFILQPQRGGKDTLCLVFVCNSHIHSPLQPGSLSPTECGWRYFCVRQESEFPKASRENDRFPPSNPWSQKQTHSFLLTPLLIYKVQSHIDPN